MSIITHFRKIFILVLVESIFLTPGLSKAQSPIQDSGCLECHGDREILNELTDENIALLVPGNFSDISIHRDIGCTGCHADPGGYPHPEVLGMVQCSECHANEHTDYINSPHGTQSVTTLQSIPNCWDCHALHQMRSSSDSKSKVHKNNEWKTCTECHLTDGDDFLSDKSRIDLSVKNGNVLFTRGIHSLKIVENEENNSLTCTDCHGFHSLSAELGAEWKDNYSTENEFCGECHTTEFMSFKNSVHSEIPISSINGDVNLNCSDCHLEHEFIDVSSLRKEESDALITDNCVECHLPVVITSQFAQNARGYTEKVESFHGVKSLHGNLMFQNCSTCHGIHEITSFAGEDPEFVTLQISENCGRCHPNAAENFTASLVHLQASVEIEDGVKMARIVMILLVYATMSIILITIIGDIYKAIRRMYR